MKKFFKYISICFLLSYLTPILSIHATDASSEYQRFIQWRASLKDTDSLIFDMQSDMYLQSDDVLRGTLDDDITIQANGFHIYISGDSNIQDIVIEGKQDYVIQVASHTTLILDSVTIHNEGEIAIQAGDNANVQAIGNMDDLTLIQAKKIGIQAQGSLTVSICRIIAPQAIENATTLFLNTCDIQGHVDADTIHSDMSYLASYSSSSLERNMMTISHNYWNEPYEDLYVSFEKGTKLNQTIVSYLHGTIFLRTDSDVIEFATSYIVNDSEEPAIIYPDFYKRLLQQNPHQYVKGFTPTKITIGEFDSFIPTISILARGGYYAYVELPSAYGADAVYLDISKDNEHWTTYDNDVVIDTENPACITTYMYPDELIYKDTYYFRIRIHGGIYDDYQSNPIQLTINNTILDMVFPFVKQEHMDTPPEIVFPIQPDEIPELETPEHNPNDIDGNKGQGGGRDESNYQPLNNDTSPKKDNASKDPSITAEQKTTSKNAPEQKNKEIIATNDSTNIKVYILSGFCTIIVCLLIFGSYRKRTTS